MYDKKWIVDQILMFEADGSNHSGVEIDNHLKALAFDRGLSATELSEMHTTNRSVFLNAVDWAKAELTKYRWHSVVSHTAVHNEAGKLARCQVYCITPGGREELRARTGQR